jgi:hypothetical protein
MHRRFWNEKFDMSDDKVNCQLSEEDSNAKKSLLRFSC